MSKLVSSILVFLSSSIKFSLGTLAAIAADLGFGGSLANVIGGIIGIVLFTYLGGFMQSYLIKRFPKRFNRRFTTTNRLLVKVKQRFGLGGIAAITPVVLSIPVGVMFALSLTHDKRKIIFSMITSILFWATIFFLPYFLFNINIIDMIRRVFEG